MKKIFLLTILSFGFNFYAQKVTNVFNRQEQSTIFVSYDLETKTPCKIELYLSINGGTTWQGPLKKVSGDVGANVGSGNKNITWNVLEEFEELSGNNIVFQVRASSLELETVTIGSQEWRTKNLDVTTYRNGDVIPEVNDPDEWANLTTGAWCYYKNDNKNGEIYGKLYNWHAVNDRRGLAPKGYHVPSIKEWDELINYLEGIYRAGGKMKEKEYTHWSSPNAEATNSSGFTGLSSGYRDASGTFYDIGYLGYWWSSSVFGTKGAWSRKLEYTNGHAYRSNANRANGFSVRCIKD
jgi:uncharacterized protein (TIGR02145 family)